MSVLAPLLAQIQKLVLNPQDSCSTTIRQVKEDIAMDLDARYQDLNVRTLMNKSTLLDTCLKSQAHT